MGLFKDVLCDEIHIAECGHRRAKDPIKAGALR